MTGDGGIAVRLLVNASRRDDVYVLAGGKPKRLHRVAPPVIVDDYQSDASEAVFAVGEAGRAVTATLTVKGPPAVDMVLGALPVQDGVVYLVDPETRMRFPSRDDLVVPVTFTMWRSRRLVKELRKAATRKQRLKAFRREFKRVPHAKRFVLASVTFAVPSVVGLDADAG